MTSFYFTCHNKSRIPDIIDDLNNAYFRNCLLPQRPIFIFDEIEENNLVRISIKNSEDVADPGIVCELARAFLDGYLAGMEWA